MTSSLGAKSDFDSAQLRQCLGAFVTGVTVITTVGPDGRWHGRTANSFSSVSLDPPLILWSLRRQSSTFAIFSSAQRFAVNILAEDQVEISKRFSASVPDQFAGLAITEGIGGLPKIDGCAAHLECRKEASYPGGDHVVFLGRVERISNTGRKPLAFGSGKYMVVHPHDLGALSGDLGSGSIATLKALHLARPVVEELGHRTDKTVGLAVWGNLGPTIIWWVEGSRPLEVRLRAGLVVPLLKSATGLVFAAFSPPELTEPFIQAELAQETPSGSPGHAARQTVDALLRDVRAKRLGSVTGAVVPNINERGINAFSAPVFDRVGSIILAITMMGNAQTFGGDDPAVSQLRDAAASLSQRLGYRQRNRG